MLAGGCIKIHRGYKEAKQTNGLRRTSSDIMRGMIMRRVAPRCGDGENLGVSCSPCAAVTTAISKYVIKGI